MERLLYMIRGLIPRNILQKVLSPYHYLWAFLSALYYRFPSRHLFVIAVTGTKGKSSTVEILNSILEEAGYKTAIMGTIRFKVGSESLPNLYKMTMPGRQFTQQFLREAVKTGCRIAIIEITSEAVLQHRHRFIDLNALVFTNLAPEHIESHGSFEAYGQTKLKLRDALEASPKKEKYMVANVDDVWGKEFLNIKNAMHLPYSLKDADPIATTSRGVLLTLGGMSIPAPLIGVFNIYNILGATTLAQALGVGLETIKRALEKIEIIPGRAERIDEGQPFSVIVDYAHTPDSLEKLYQAFKDTGSGTRRICVLGNTGGGRDTWKRPEMGRIADEYCSGVILTNEDPYDEDPGKIVDAMAVGMKRHKPLIIMDRREAIRTALLRAQSGDVVLITGKGTDPYIMGPRGRKEPWSDKEVVRQELRALKKRAVKDSVESS
jgi:UDP-N-acetylmuramoyl-L-alanyl-D-glutamate--2,6-diaminopimelate ligase